MTTNQVRRSGLRCPECGRKPRVIDSRPRVDGGVLRRRECPKGHRFNTIETLAINPGSGSSFADSALAASSDVAEVFDYLQRMLDRAKRRITKGTTP